MNKSGFTMVEMIAVLVLVGILSAVIVSRLATTVGGSEFSERLLLKSNLRFARQRSMETTNNWSVVFSGNGYSLASDWGGSKTFPSIDSGTHTALIPFSGAGTIEFESPHGTPLGGTKTVSVGGSSVTVHSTGAIE